MSQLTASIVPSKLGCKPARPPPLLHRQQQSHQPCLQFWWCPPNFGGSKLSGPCCITSKNPSNISRNIASFFPLHLGSKVSLHPRATLPVETNYIDEIAEKQKMATLQDVYP